MTQEKLLQNSPVEASLETYFDNFRQHIVGINHHFDSPYGEKRILYADWTASGRLFQPIEDKLHKEIGPFVANTHTETSITGAAMTQAYHKARDIIKAHVNASDKDVLISVGSGMTGAINKFQRILGLKVSEGLEGFAKIPDELRPIVFVSHMEHHSNQISWIETIAQVEVIPCNEEGLICLHNLEAALEKFKDRKIKFVSVTACSNVTGIKTDYHAIAKITHQYGGLCFVDFACSAPYVEINMHPDDPEEALDAIFFSPHKFLGGPGSSGILVFHQKLYANLIPDNPGGGTVTFTDPWGGRKYINDIEIREDGGTPAFLQTIKVALAMQLKDQMGVKNILAREYEINEIMFERLSKIKGLHLYAGEHKDRLGIFSFSIQGIHYNLLAKLLNDRFGIQSRGGCSCAGTYGHHLFNLSKIVSETIQEMIQAGCLTDKPGWVRISIHPTMRNAEIQYICDALESIVANHESWKEAYKYNLKTNDFDFKGESEQIEKTVNKWFQLSY
ncbi:MAG: aminotransferase class V-fold PLP-dependent enzyme [Bacteroidota bacterium]